MYPSILERFEGALLGAAIGDALGGKFEARSPESIRAQYPTPRALSEDNKLGELWYTDDTQMLLAVGECLVACRRIDESMLCRLFVANYNPSRGYGRGTRAVIEAIEENADYRQVAENYFSGGSLGNGGAMRVAPVGLFFHDNHDQLFAAARLSAMPTHTHPLAIEGAQLQAMAVALALTSSPDRNFQRSRFFMALHTACQSHEFRSKLNAASAAVTLADAASLGNGIEAVNSVPTAICIFSLNPNSYIDTVGSAILLGGDTDTIACMAGAISGAFLGVRAVPHGLLNRLEESPKGRTYIRRLAGELLRAKGDASS
jgi:poly(ADP-ribose) glycohydrolase ARH3